MYIDSKKILEKKKFYNLNPEPGFSPSRNKSIIEESIRKADENRVKVEKAWTAKFRERANMLTDYIFSPKSTSMEMEKYFGPRWMGFLRGQEIMGELSGLNKRKFV